MAVFDNFPYTNNHELNLDWMIDRTEKVLKASDEIAANTVIAQEAAENAKASEEASADYYTLTSQLVGKPLAANTAAEMTDTSTIYIYTGDEPGYDPGHWYYYNGSAWQDGGVYGADGGINTNARNLLKYILEHVAYTQTGMQTYVDALYQALEQGGDTPSVTTYMIINALTNVTNSNDATGCNEGDSYTATLTADTDYVIDSVTVTVGGIDVTSTVYNSSTGVITITSVTGDVVIAASAITYTYAVEYQGNYTTQTPANNRVTLITNDITFNANGVHTFSVTDGYQLYLLFSFGAGGDTSKYNTAKASNQIYVNARTAGGTVYDTEQYIVEGNNNMSPVLTVGNTTGWVASNTITNGHDDTLITPIGFYVKKSDDSNISISEAKSVVTIN